MGIPQITDRMRTRPTEALRAVFTGIGRILMAADRPQATAVRPPDQGSRANGRAGSAGGGAQRPSGMAPASSRWRSLDQTGNVRLLSPDDLDDGFSGPGQPGTETHERDREGQPGPVTSGSSAGPDSQAAAVAAEGQLAAEPAGGLAAEPAAASVTAAALPLPGYDSLSLASIRARLRGLDIGQLRALASYEATHAERPEVLGMFERRIEKLEAGG